MPEQFNLEANVLDINQFLSQQNLNGLQEGMVRLDRLLHSLVPLIESQRRPMTLGANTENSGPKLAKFVKLQDNFRYNIVLNMTGYLPWIYDNIDTLDAKLIGQYNRLLQGLLLIHAQSRCIFSNTKEITQLLKFIELDNSKVDFEITIAFITSLLHVLLKNLDNFRIFEHCNGCSVLIKKLKIADFSVPEIMDNSSDKNKKANQQMLNFKVIEFLIFYLSDESKNTEFSDKRKSIKEKSDYFRQDFPDIDSLIDSLNELKNI